VNVLATSLGRKFGSRRGAGNLGTATRNGDQERRPEDGRRQNWTCGIRLVTRQTARLSHWSPQLSVQFWSTLRRFAIAFLAMGPLRVLPTHDLLGVQALKFDGASQIYSHYNDAFSIATLFRSESSISFRGKAHQAMDGGVGLLEPDGIFRHLQIPVAESVGKLHIEQSVMDEARHVLGARTGPVRVRTVIARSPALFRALSELHESLEQEASGLERQELFARALERVFADGIDGSVARKVAGYEVAAVKRARDILHARYAEQISLRELAEATGLSQFHLLRVFGRSLGLPPHQYQTHLRLAHARALLNRGEPASQVAVAVGFADQSHFVRAFRRSHGLTPGAFFARAKGAAST